MIHGETVFKIDRINSNLLPVSRNTSEHVNRNTIHLPCEK